MEAPYFIVALPQLQDENFARSVVLITSHSSEGAFGIILNKALVDEEDGPALMRAEIKDTEGNTLFEFNEDLFQGGPVNDESIFVIHEIADLPGENVQIVEGLYLSTDPSVFQKLLERTESKPHRRFYLGSSSWTAGQLDSELRTGSWMPIPLEKKFLFEVVPAEKLHWRDELWKRALLHGGVDPLTVMGQGAGDAGVN